MSKNNSVVPQGEPLLTGSSRKLQERLAFENLLKKSYNISKSV